MAFPSIVVLSGATGLIGGALVTELVRRGATVRALTRSPERSMPEGVTPVGWDGSNVPREAVEGSDAVVHLSGENVFGGMPTRARKHRIHASRIDSTRSFAGAIEELPAEARPASFVCASAVGIYGSRGETILDEQSEPGEGFLANVCIEWEAAAAAIAALGPRVVSLRIGVVISRQGGALGLAQHAFRLGLGGRFGDGKQWFPWVHVDDVVGAILHALEDERLVGPVNAVSPQPVRNAEFTRALAGAVSRPAVVPVPALALRLALGEFADELLGSRRVAPKRLRETGFAFRHENIDEALATEFPRRESA